MVLSKFFLRQGLLESSAEKCFNLMHSRCGRTSDMFRQNQTDFVEARRIRSISQRLFAGTAEKEVTSKLGGEDQLSHGFGEQQLGLVVRKRAAGTSCFCGDGCD